MKRVISLIIATLIGLTSVSYAAGFEPTVDYLKRQELDGWGILALYSSGCSVSGMALDRVDGSDVTTDYEAYIMGAVALERDVSDYGKKIINAQRASGKFADYTDGTGEDLVNAHIWGIISLYAADLNSYDRDKALEWLKQNQNQDGGFPVFAGDPASDPDMTAMGIIAYSILGLNESSNQVKKALTFLEGYLDKRESCETIAWYVLAKVKLGLQADQRLLGRLMEYRMQDGSFKHLKSSPGGNYMATWHGLLAVNDYNNRVSIFEVLHNLKRFTDLQKGDYAYDEIMYLVNRGVLSGYPDGTFRPDSPVKRAEFAKFLVYGLGLQNRISEGTLEFSDLKGHWSNKIVGIAVEEGLIKGVGSGRFAPEDRITGAQVAAMLVRAKGVEGSVQTMAGGNWYDGYVRLAGEQGLLYEGFDPNGYATRAQCAEAIVRLHRQGSNKS